MENKDSQSQPSEDSSESSVLHGNDVFVNKVLLRSSSSSRLSLGRDSDMYACKLPGKVPFQWEVQPGIPKDPPNEEQNPSSSPTLESPPRLKDLSFKSNQNQIIQTRTCSTETISCLFNRSKKTLKESPEFSPYASYNSDDYDFFSSASASKSSSSTSATDSSPSSKALVTSLPMSSKLRRRAKGLLQRLF